MNPVLGACPLRPGSFLLVVRPRLQIARMRTQRDGHFAVTS